MHVVSLPLQSVEVARFCAVMDTLVDQDGVTGERVQGYLCPGMIDMTC